MVKKKIFKADSKTATEQPQKTKLTSTPMKTRRAAKAARSHLPKLEDKEIKNKLVEDVLRIVLINIEEIENQAALKVTSSASTDGKLSNAKKSEAACSHPTKLEDNEIKNKLVEDVPVSLRIVLQKINMEKLENQAASSASTDEKLSDAKKSKNTVKVLGNLTNHSDKKIKNTNLSSSTKTKNLQENIHNKDDLIISKLKTSKSKQSSTATLSRQKSDRNHNYTKENNRSESNLMEKNEKISSKDKTLNESIQDLTLMKHSTPIKISQNVIIHSCISFNVELTENENHISQINSTSPKHDTEGEESKSESDYDWENSIKDLLIPPSTNIVNNKCRRFQFNSLYGIYFKTNSLPSIENKPLITYDLSKRIFGEEPTSTLVEEDKENSPKEKRVKKKSRPKTRKILHQLFENDQSSDVEEGNPIVELQTKTDSENVLEFDDSNEQSSCWDSTNIRRYSGKIGNKSSGPVIFDDVEPDLLSPSPPKIIEPKLLIEPAKKHHKSYSKKVKSQENIEEMEFIRKMQAHFAEVEKHQLEIE